MQCITGTQPDASMHPNMYFRVENVFNAEIHYEQTLSEAILPMLVYCKKTLTPCFNLPKQSTFPSLLLRLLLLNSQTMNSTPHNDAPNTTVHELHARNISFVLPSRKYIRILLVRIGISVETQNYSATSSCNVRRQPSWHAPGGKCSNYVARHRYSSHPPYHNHTFPPSAMQNCT